MIAAVGLTLALLAPVQEPLGDKRRLTSAPDRRVELDFQHYYKTRELRLALSSLAAAYPEFVQLASVGKSRGGEDLWMVTLSDLSNGDPSTKPALFVAAAQSPLDVQGSELALSTLVEFLQNHAREERVARALRETTMYFAPCVHPDLRGALLAALESGSNSSAARARVDLDRNYPVGWEPFEPAGDGAVGDPGPYPLSEAETRAIASFLYAHANVGTVIGFAPDAMQRGDSALRGLLAADRIGLRRVLEAPSIEAGTRVVCFADPANPGGSLDDFAYGQLGALPLRLWCAPADSQSGLALPHPDAIAPLAQRVAASILSVSEALPRLTVAGTSVQRLKNDLWQIEITLGNAGTLRTQSALGSDRHATPTPRLRVDGAKLAAAGLRRQGEENFAPQRVDAGEFDLAELDGGEQLRARVLLAAPAETSLTLTARSPRAGTVSAVVVLR